MNTNSDTVFDEERIYNFRWQSLLCWIEFRSNKEYYFLKLLFFIALLI